ncbi:MAG: helix-turn-helix domain-containing protein [Propionibacteriaceae bacterium]
MHVVAVLAFDGVVAFDVTTATEVFGGVRLAGGEVGYEVVVCGPRTRVTAGPLGLTVPHRLKALERADTIVVPGLRDLEARAPETVLAALRRAHARGARVVSICAGALTLADAGLLAQRNATTHWQAAQLLAARSPDTHVDSNVLFIDDGDILTSAGAAAGIDLCLHLVHRDHGAAVAAASARHAVVPLTREGGQAQYIPVHQHTPASSSLHLTLQWLSERIAEPWTLDDIAAHAHLAVRTLNRRFRDVTGQTPLQWVHRERIRQAQVLLETTDSPVEEIAHTVGFGSAAAFRTVFRRTVGTAPSRYRATFFTGSARDAG